MDTIPKTKDELDYDEVPYSVALTQNFAIFLLSNDYTSKKNFKIDYISKKLFPKETIWSDPYRFYYDNFSFNRLKGPIPKGLNFIKAKLIHDRIW